MQQIQKSDQLDQKQLLHQQKCHNKQCVFLIIHRRALPNL